MKNITLRLAAFFTLAIIVAGACEGFAQALPPPPPAGVPLDPLSWVILGAGGTAACVQYYRVKNRKKDGGIE